MQKINPNYACAIGNDYNDISMFKKVKYRVAMANSIKKLKNKANYITLSNNDNKYTLTLKNVSVPKGIYRIKITQLYDDINNRLTTKCRFR